MADLGLVHFKSNEDIVADEKRVELQRAEAMKKQVWESGLVAQINRDWERAKRAKQEVDYRLLDCLRRRNGEYAPDKLAAIRAEGGSEIYMQLTSTKCRALVAWVRDVLLGAGERAWGLDPTPVSEVPPEIMQQLQRNVAMVIQRQAGQGQQVDPQQAMRDALNDLKKRAYEAAKEAAERMETTIDDQFHEGGWYDALREFVEDFATFPAGVMKGPVLQRKKVLSWAEGWQPVPVFEITPSYYRVSPFDFYPSPEATNCDDAAYLIERVRFTRRSLKKMRGVPGNSDEGIDNVLREHGIGGLRDWLFTDSERAKLEGRDDFLVNDSETIDGLIYTGSAIGLKLLQWGVDPSRVDPLEEYEIEATLIGRHLVRVVINVDPLERRKYSKASFQNIPGAFWGTCPPELMADIQDTCNATARALINNLAMASGPMVEVNYDRLAPEEDADIYPWKTWQTRSSQTSGRNPAVNFFQPDSLAGELMGVYNQFEIKADDATNIPRYTYGNEKVQGAGSTMGGLSMLMDAASKGIKDCISNIDRGVVRRNVEATWMYNMLYNPDPTIKGDVKVIARGATALLMRERSQMLRNEFLASTSNPLDQEIIGPEGRAKLLRKSAENLDVPDLVPEVDDLEQRLEKQREASSKRDAAEFAANLDNILAKTQDLQASAEKKRADAGSNLVEDRHTAAETDKTKAETGKIRKETMSDESDEGADGGATRHGRNPGVQQVGVPHRGGTGPAR